MSPNGRWLAYSSSESGRSEIYVRPFLREGERRQVSPTGGSSPNWARNGRELFFLRGAEMWAMDVRGDGSIILPGTPHKLFTGSRSLPGSLGETDYDVAPDGRFLMLKAGQSQPPSRQIDVVLNWIEELEHAHR